MIYHLGIIDFLQPWTPFKMIESFYKTTLLMQDKQLVSCQNPAYYQERFINFISKEVLRTNLTDISIRNDLRKALDLSTFQSIYINWKLNYNQIGLLNTSQISNNLDISMNDV